MPTTQPVVIGRREVQDDELRHMLLTASVSGDTADFFRRFEYFLPGDPFTTLARGEALLTKCKILAPGVYAKLHKGTPFYWLAWATFAVHDYETFAFYIDAAVSDDLKSADDARNDRNNIFTPALLFFLINDASHDQALLPLVRILREKIDSAIIDYNARPDANPTPLTFIDVQSRFLRPAILKGNEHLRTLVTTFISFFLEWDHRSELIELRTEQGTAEPFFIHLFKGCVLFESLLKASSKNKLKSNTLNPILKELKVDLGFCGKPDMEIGGFDFEDVIKSVSSDNNHTYTAIERTGRIRNTTGHNLGWQVSLTADAYNSLAAYVASSCLHAVACLYR